MPCMPALVASGSAGYLNASITDVPMLSVTVKCVSTYQVLTGGEGSILNGNNAIELFSLQDGTALIQISTSTDTACSASALHLSTPTIDLHSYLDLKPSRVWPFLQIASPKVCRSAKAFANLDGQFPVLNCSPCRLVGHYQTGARLSSQYE